VHLVDLVVIALVAGAVTHGLARRSRSRRSQMVGKSLAEAAQRM
jgi:hypothetical protein